MADKRIKLILRWLPVVYFPLVLLVSILFLSQAAQNTALFSQLYGQMLTLVVLTVLLLLFVIGRNFYELVQRYRSRELGSRLSMRLFAGFMLLTIVPALFLYLMSVSFVQRSVDSWFDSSLEQTLASALDKGQKVMAIHHQKLQRQLELLANQMSAAPEEQYHSLMREFPVYQAPVYLALQGSSGLIEVKNNLIDPVSSIDVLPDAEVDMLLAKNETAFLLDFLQQDVLYARFYVPVTSAASANKSVLIAIFGVNEDIGALGQVVQQAYSGYQELKFSREPLKASFVLTLSLALLQAVLTAMWAALFFSNRLVVPIRALAVGTREVAVGQYGKMLDPVDDEEMNTLIQSFNDMTLQVNRAQDDARRNQEQAEAQKLYLQTVLSRLSTGVMTFDPENNLLSFNSAAERILDIAFKGMEGKPIERIFVDFSEFRGLLDEFAALQSEKKFLREQLVINRTGWHKILLVSLSRLPATVGWVMVFDDITRIVEAQRQQAWAEVARRMAHEIKNPLTPIQLSAERLRQKYLGRLPEEDDALEKLTSSIIAQVESMKELVKSFSDYTRLPEVNPAEVDLNQLVSEVMEMYRDVADIKIVTRLYQMPVVCAVDRLMIRQVLHNLLKNALHATRDANGEQVVVSTEREDGYVIVNIDDQGGGVDEKIARRIFDPYFTTKAKGSGLGLAIAKKIMQEHGGDVKLINNAPAGARFQLRFPAGAAVATGNSRFEDQFSA